MPKLDRERRSKIIQEIKVHPYLAIECRECWASVGEPCRDQTPVPIGTPRKLLERAHRQRLLDVAYDIEAFSKARVILQAIDHLDYV